MKVSCCTQVFSYQVGSLMKRIALWNIEDENRLTPKSVDTAELILFMDKMFDSLNSSCRMAPASKPLKGGVSRGSPHQDFWTSGRAIDEFKLIESTGADFVQIMEQYDFRIFKA
ncbi:uncharacterized protein LOC123308113 [Coccinella septempunctata]|uniref:uncharacterized protein LOC123308113 n=1 Tax=Coccinella septempunctata TaxID=41139 RepID=UPI001D08020C|nr:uncharacterized protein LOC123308113 [Coccinella septempunctata]